MAGSAHGGQSSGGPSRTGVFLEDELFEGVALSQILIERGLEPMRAPDPRSLGAWIDALPSIPEVLILPIGDDPAAVEALRAVHGSKVGRCVPVLAVASLSNLDLDLAWLQATGVRGVVEPDSAPMLVAQRLEQIVRTDRPRRAHERVSCFFPIQIEEGGSVRTEYALSLSLGGLRITSAEAPPLETVLGGRFVLPMVSSQELDLCLRVVNRAPVRNSQGLAEVGVFFLGVPAAAAAILEAEVARLRDR